MSETDLVQYLLAALVCVLSAFIGFNRPTWCRSYTTALRFRAALLVHAAIYLVAFLGACFLARKLLRAEFTGEVAWLAALGVVAVRVLWSWPRRWLHHTVGIPRYAHHLAMGLADSELNPSEEVLEEAYATLVSRGVEVGADWLPIAQPTHKLLLKATMLFVQIRKWEQQRQFASFLREAKNDVDLLRKRFDRLSFRVSRSLASIERLGEVRHLYSSQAEAPEGRRVDDLVRKIVGDLLADSCEDVRAFHEDACLLTARATLMTQSTRKRRRSLLRSLGFELNGNFDRVGYGFLIATAMLLYAGVWLLFELQPSRDGASDAPAYLTPLVSIIVFGSLVISIVPKLRWGFANAGLKERTPLLFVVGAGLCAMLFAALVHLSAGALLIGGMEGALERLEGGAPWIPGMFFIAATMAWLVQDHRWQFASSASARRLLDALMFGGAWVVAALLGAVIRAQLLDTVLQPSDLLWKSIFSFLLGAAISQFTAEYARDSNVRAPAQPALRFDNIPYAKPRPVTA